MTRERFSWRMAEVALATALAAGTLAAQKPEADVAVVRAPAIPASVPSGTAPPAVWLGDQVGIGSATSLTVREPAAAGSLVVVLVAGRASTIGTVRDSRGNVWQSAVEATNSSGLCAVGVFHATLTRALAVGDGITATWSGSGRPQARAIGALKASNVKTLDQIGSAAQDSATNLSAETRSAVTAPAELLVSATCTGQSQATTFANANGFARQLQFSGSLSSGALSYRIGSGLSGVQSYLSTAQAASGGAANFATVIATFK